MKEKSPRLSLDFVLPTSLPEGNRKPNRRRTIASEPRKKVLSSSHATTEAASDLKV
jgi:hypothetical protein